MRMKSKRNQKERRSKLLQRSLNINRTSVAAALATWNEASYIKSKRPKNRALVHKIKLGTSPLKKEQYQRDDRVAEDLIDPEPLKTYQKFFNVFSTFAKLVGIEFSYHWQPKTYLMFRFTIFLLVFVWISILYTQGIRLNDGETMRVLEACAIYGIASSCTQKFTGYIKHRNEILALFFCIRKMCQQNKGIRARMLNSHLCKTLECIKLLAKGVVSSVLMFVACPLREYFVKKELMSLLPLEIMFVDQSTVIGFLIANAVMAVLGIYASLGIILYSTVFIFCIQNYSLQVDLIGQDFKDFDEMWTKGSVISNSYKKAYLINICKKRQDIKNYMDSVRDIFQTKFKFYFFFNYYSQIICLFEVTYNDWTPGYAIALTSFIEMMFYCYMGTQITVADERLCYIIYNTKWYKYDLQSQKMIRLLLHRCQITKGIRLGPIGQLSVVKGIEIVKSIYTYYTVLTEVL